MLSTKQTQITNDAFRKARIDPTFIDMIKTKNVTGGFQPKTSKIQEFLKNKIARNEAEQDVVVCNYDKEEVALTDLEKDKLVLTYSLSASQSLVWTQYQAQGIVPKTFRSHMKVVDELAYKLKMKNGFEKLFYKGRRKEMIDYYRFKNSMKKYLDIE